MIQEEIQDRINQNLECKKLMDDFMNNESFQDKFINDMLENTEKKLNSLENIYNKNKDLRLIYASLLCKKYKYLDLKNIKYNFIVTYIDKNTDYRGNTKTTIEIVSINSKIEGKFEKVEWSNDNYTTTYIDQEANIIKSDERDLFDYLLCHINFE